MSCLNTQKGRCSLQSHRARDGVCRAPDSFPWAPSQAALTVAIAAIPWTRKPRPQRQLTHPGPRGPPVELRWEPCLPGAWLLGSLSSPEPGRCSALSQPSSIPARLLTQASTPVGSSWSSCPRLLSSHLSAITTTVRHRPGGRVSGDGVSPTPSRA